MTTNATVKILTEDDTRGHTALYGGNASGQRFPGFSERAPECPSSLPTHPPLLGKVAGH